MVSSVFGGSLYFGLFSSEFLSGSLSILIPVEVSPPGGFLGFPSLQTS